MPDHYDPLETRTPVFRDSEEFALLPKIVAHAMAAPGWASHLEGFDPKSVTSRAALAKLPVLPKSDIAALQKANPPFGGLAAMPPGKARRLQMSPGSLFEPEGHGKDFGNCARALFAAGFRAGDIVHNSFSYHLTPGAYILEEGALALGCAVIPGGVGNTEQQLEAIAHYKPSGYVGTPDFLKILFDTAEKREKTLPRSSARWFPARRCRPAYATNSANAVSRYCNAMPSPSSASSPTKARRAKA